MFRRTLESARLRLLNWLSAGAGYRIVLRDLAPIGDLPRVADAMASLRAQARLRARVERPPSGTLAVVAPHPDDESIGPGGTLLAARDAGARIAIGFATDPDGRRHEAEAACADLGAAAHFFGHRPRAIPTDETAARALAAWLDGVAPTALFLPFLADDHDDHRRVNSWLLAAARRGGLKARPEIWAYQVYTSMPCTTLVDVTDFADAKRALIARHESQIRDRDWASIALGLNAYNARFAGRGQAGRCFEGFFVLPFDAYIDLCARYFDGAGSNQS
jgi:LmbE family N-acetylglucosaminyl deacetylase